MNIPEKYRDRYDRLAESHPWMREMRDGETNGIDGGTNGIADDSPLVDELPEGDALDLMKNKGVRQILKVLGIEHDCKKHMTKMLRVLADMVERDYVSREVFEDLRDEFVWETTFLHRMGKKCGTKDVPSLVAYVDKLEAEIIEYDKALDAVKNERDEWKAKAEQQSNLEWLFEHDTSLNRWAVTRANALVYVADGASAGEWLLSPHVDANDDLPPENGVRAGNEGANDANADTREKVNALRAHYGAGPTTMTDEQIEAGREVYGAKKDVDMVIVDELHIDEPDTIRNEQIDNGQLAPESDSREKLEEEICAKLNDMARFSWRVDGIFRQAQSWLDRQAAITERELCKQCEWPSLAAQPDRETQDRITDLQNQMDDLRDEWHRVCDERMKLRRELTAEKNKALDIGKQLGDCMAERDEYRAMAGKMLDAAQEIRRIADASMPEGARAVM